VALALASGALLAFPRRPGFALALFALALLTKATALFALPVAIAWSALPGPRAEAWRRRRPWLLAWTGAALAWALPAFFLFQRIGQHGQALDPDLLVSLRTAVAIGARYVWMAITARGVAPFHQPALAALWTDPWWLAGVALAAFFSWRLWVSLMRGSEAGAWWLWAAAAYAPVSQLLPFRYPMADRYLYFVLPGLIGAACFELRAARGRAVRARVGVGVGQARLASGALLGLAFAIVSWNGLRSHAQAEIWRGPFTVGRAAERAYPEGAPAYWMRAERAARRGEREEMIRQLRGAQQRGYDDFALTQRHPSFARYGLDREFRSVLRGMARLTLERGEAISRPTQATLLQRARAYVVLGRPQEAVTALEDALALGGPLDDLVRAELTRLRRHAPRS